MWITKTPSGRFKYCETYIDPITNKRKSVCITTDNKSTKTQKEMTELLQKKIFNRCNPDLKVSATLKDMITAYEEYQSKQLKQSTCRRNHYQNNWVLKTLGENTIPNNYTAKYVKDRIKQETIKEQTLIEHITRLKALFRWGFQNDYMSDISWIDKIKIPPNIKKDNVKIYFMETDEIKTLLEGMKNNQWRVFTQFLLLTGLRVGEALALEKKDVDLEEKVIHITKTYDFSNDLTTTPKTKDSIRDIFIQDELLVFINENILNKRKKYFFQTEEGHYSYFAYKKYLSLISRKTLGRVVTPHMLRHTHCSIMAAQGVPLETISRRLGHRNSNITKQIYLHITKEIKEKDNSMVNTTNIL